jgi:hypothetical protein
MTFENRTARLDRAALESSVKARCNALVLQDAFNPAELQIDRHTYAATVSYLDSKLPPHGPALIPGMYAAGDVMLARVVPEFVVIKSGNASLTLQRVFATLRDTTGDVGMAMRCLVGAIPWQEASHVGRYALLLRAAIECQRGVPLPSWSLADIARNAQDDTPMRESLKAGHAFLRQQRNVKFKLENNDSTLRFQGGGK